MIHTTTSTSAAPGSRSTPRAPRTPSCARSRRGISPSVSRRPGPRAGDGRGGNDYRAHAGDAYAAPRAAGGAESLAERPDPDAPPGHHRNGPDGPDRAPSTAPGPSGQGVPLTRQPRSGPGKPG